MVYLCTSWKGLASPHWWAWDTLPPPFPPSDRAGGKFSKASNLVFFLAWGWMVKPWQKGRDEWMEKWIHPRCTSRTQDTLEAFWIFNVQVMRPSNRSVATLKWGPQRDLSHAVRYVAEWRWRSHTVFTSLLLKIQTYYEECSKKNLNRVNFSL